MERNDYIPELIPLKAQAMFAPNPEWEAAARQALERAQRAHAAKSEGGGLT